MDDGDMTIDDLVEQLNDVITGLRTTVQYNLYKDDINEKLNVSKSLEIKLANNIIKLVKN